MIRATESTKADVVVVGAGPAGLAAAIALKVERPEAEVLVLEKGAGAGEHNLSGAVLEGGALTELLDRAEPGWRESPKAQALLGYKVERENLLMLLGKRLGFSMLPAIKAARLLGLGFGQLVHKGDYSVSVSALTRWLGEIAAAKGVEVLGGFAVERVLWDAEQGRARGVLTVEQGRDKEGGLQDNYVAGEEIGAEAVVLAEGCCGYVTEQFVAQAGLQRQSKQLYSVGVKEMIEVSGEQYAAFGRDRCVHAMGYPLWTPLVGPGMFGGGIMYTAEENRIGVGMIVGADWRYRDFNPQDALEQFKEHAWVKRFIEGGEVVEAGAKMIPEGGYKAVPRDPQTGAIGKRNVVLVGDSAGFVNMLKIKGLHNAMASGMRAGEALARTWGRAEEAAGAYTLLLEESPLHKEMRKAQNFRQTVARMGNTVGMPLSTLGNLLPHFEVEADYEAMTRATYKYKPEREFDKDAFTALARVEHREEQPCHCEVRDPQVCVERCRGTYGSPCIIFCPAGVYEDVQGRMRPANPSNCLHCKTCQNKCPYDNLRWHAPEGGGGPRYRMM